MNGVIHLNITGRPRKIKRKIRYCKIYRTGVCVDSRCFTVWQGEALIYNNLVKVLSLNTVDWFPALIEKGLQHFPGKHEFSDQELGQLEAQGFIY